MPQKNLNLKDLAPLLKFAPGCSWTVMIEEGNTIHIT